MQECPRCKASLKPERNFSIWCMECDWNLSTSSAPSSSLLGKTYQKYGYKSGKKLFESLKHNQKSLQKSSVSISKILAFVFASFVHFLTVIILAIGIYIATLDWFNLILVFIGSLFILTAYALTPKFDKLPSEGMLTRKNAPNLYGFVDEIAEAMKTRRIDSICLSPEINASFSRYGMTNKSLLTLGTPLWLGLNGKEKTALIAHELAHQINGDQSRGFWVGSAIGALSSWYNFLRQPYNEDSGFVEMIIQVIFYFLSVIVYWYASILIHLFWKDSQKAEYLADHLGGKISGTKEFISLNNRIALLSMNHEWLLAKMKHEYDHKERIIPSFVNEFINTPKLEVERIKRINERELFTLDATHPPTHYRNKMLEAFPAKATIKLSKEDEVLIDAEISASNELMGKLLRVEYAYLL